MKTDRIADPRAQRPREWTEGARDAAVDVEADDTDVWCQLFSIREAAAAERQNGHIMAVFREGSSRIGGSESRTRMRWPP